MKRRAVDQPDGQSTPKRSTRNLDDGQLLAPAPIAPAPMKGLLASAANVDEDPEGTPGEEESVPASPEPPNFLNGSTGRSQKQLAREKSPPLPKTIGDPDDYGVRTYSQRPAMRAAGINSRILAPHAVWFDNWEVGFKDSSNDSAKGHTRAKRGKYLDTPNSNGLHFDHWCNGYDFSTTTPKDFDQKLVNKHGVHPKYGIFLPTSTNEVEIGDPYVMPGKPVVYIANPSGRISQASRSFQSTTNQRRSDDLPLREKMKANIRRFCKISEIDTDDIAIAEFVQSDDDLRAKSLGTAEKELLSRPQLDESTSEADEAESTPLEPEQTDGGLTAMSVLTYASAYVAAQEVTQAAPPTPKPARYDAIRDVFTDSKPDPVPAPAAKSMELNFLAELCNVESRLPGGSGSVEHANMFASIADPDSSATIKREEPPAVSSFSHAPMGSRLSQEPHALYTHTQQSEHMPLLSGGPLHDRMGYPVPTPQEPSHRQEYKPYQQAPGPPVQDHGGYFQHPTYAPPDRRESHMSSGRHIDPGYNPRRLSGYGADAPPPATYGQYAWPAQQPPSSMSGGSSVAPPSSHQSYPPPPPPSGSRMPFSQSASAEPLPPLRPPRGRTQSVPDEPPYDHSMRGSMHNSYYPPPPSSRSYHRGYPVPEPHHSHAAPQPPPLQPISGDRILPSPHQTSQPPYMGSPPPPGYGQQILSPTFANAPGLPGQIGQSPPGTPLGPPGSIHRHRSTPSGSSDAGSNKYRKLQPAPVPAHRVWSNKPELKTIPYDHKETGSSAALPSSGPTQIRGWNVNQHRKRSKQDKGDASNDREESR